MKSFQDFPSYAELGRISSRECERECQETFEQNANDRNGNLRWSVYLDHGPHLATLSLSLSLSANPQQSLSSFWAWSACSAVSYAPLIHRQSTADPPPIHRQLCDGIHIRLRLYGSFYLFAVISDLFPHKAWTAGAPRKIRQADTEIAPRSSLIESAN